MKSSRIAVACAVAFGAALYSIYALFAAHFMTRVESSSLDVARLIAVFGMFGGFAAVMATFAVRRRVPVPLLLLFGTDFFATLGIGVAYALTKLPWLLPLAYSIDGAAITALVVGGPACLVFFTAVEIWRNQRVGRVLLGALLEMAALYFFIGALSYSTGAFQFNSFPALLLVAARQDIAAGAVPQVLDAAAIAPLAATYCSLLLVAGLAAEPYNPSTRLRLALALASTLVTIGGVSLASYYLQETLMSFPIRVAVAAFPLTAGLAAIWLMSRRASKSSPTIVIREAPSSDAH